MMWTKKPVLCLFHAIVTRVLTQQNRTVRAENLNHEKENGHGIVPERLNSCPGKVPGSALYSPDNAAPELPAPAIFFTGEDKSVGIEPHESATA